MKTLRLTAALALMLTLAACTTYHVGTPLPKELRNISLGKVVNLSQEDALSHLLRDRLAERILQTPGLKLSSDADATLDLSVKILSLDQSKAARALMRDRKASHDDSDRYQTVLYRLEMECEYLGVPRDSALSPRKGRVRVTADVPLLQDLALSQQKALQELARAAAWEILSDLSLDD